MYIIYRLENMMVNYNKLMEKLKEKGITTYVIRQKGLIPQSTLTKLKMCPPRIFWSPETHYESI